MRAFARQNLYDESEPSESKYSPTPPMHPKVKGDPHSWHKLPLVYEVQLPLESRFLSLPLGDAAERMRSWGGCSEVRTSC